MCSGYMVFLLMWSQTMGPNSLHTFSGLFVSSNFGDQFENMLRDRIVCGVQDPAETVAIGDSSDLQIG